MRLISRSGVLPAIAALFFMSGGLAMAQKTIESTNVSGTPYSSRSHFAKKAAMGGMLEVKLGQLAVQKTSNNQVRQFGQRMIDDHSKADSQLQAIASKDDITLPTQLGPRDQAIYDRLAGLSGTAFDRVYMRNMVRDHQQDVNEFQREASNGANPDLKNFASTNLPALQDHLRIARETENSLGITSRR